MKRMLGVGLFVCFLLIAITPVQAQQEQLAQISLDVQISDVLANSQTIDPQSLLSNGSGPMLYQIYLNNDKASEYANNLYLEVYIRSDKVGVISHVTQVNGQPFSLSPGQKVYVTNNDLGNGNIPGIEEAIQFDGGLTSAGQKFVNNLQGNLPSDRYSVEINIYQGGPTLNKVASANAEIVTNVVEDTNNFYLVSPGDVIGSNTIISNRYPNFQWQGSTKPSYRCLVVEAKGDESPQSLMEGAASTAPIKVNGTSSGGSLVDYEMLDVVVDGNSYQYPNTGVQNLEPGKTYYWRIIMQLKSGDGVEKKVSDIWSFTLANNQKSSVAQNSGDFSKALKTVLGDKFQEFSNEGYSFKSVKIDGKIYQGGQALQKLLDLSRKANQGDVSIVIEEQ